jgi:hypothetical protein
MNPIPDMQLYRSEIEVMKPEIVYEDQSKLGEEC